jgi:hypothetical protein
LRFPDESSSQCFSDDAEIEASLAAMVVVSKCSGDTFVLGATARKAASVTIGLRDGTTVPAVLYPRPPGSRVRAQYYLAVLPGTPKIGMVESLDANGGLVGRERHPDGTGTNPCGLFAPD